MLLLRCLLLLGSRLAARLPLRLGEQITCLPASFSGDLTSLVRRGLGDIAARLARMLADVRRLVSRDIGRGRLVRQPCSARGIGIRILGHSGLLSRSR
jgi:hypothetical protein